MVFIVKSPLCILNIPCAVVMLHYSCAPKRTQPVSFGILQIGFHARHACQSDIALCPFLSSGSVQIPWERAISPNKVPYYIK